MIRMNKTKKIIEIEKKWRRAFHMNGIFANTRVAIEYEWR
jgi:hypothetical protein